MKKRVRICHSTAASFESLRTEPFVVNEVNKLPTPSGKLIEIIYPTFGEAQAKAALLNSIIGKFTLAGDVVMLDEEELAYFFLAQ